MNSGGIPAEERLMDLHQQVSNQYQLKECYHQIKVQATQKRVLMNNLLS